MRNAAFRSLPLFLFTLVCLAAPAGTKPGSPQTGETQAGISQELATMYEADQSVRKRFAFLSKEEQQEMVRADTRHRTRVLEILRTDGLRSGEDFYHAAMILQHSNPGTPDYTLEHYLLAHALASVAAFEGHEKARWLSAATLDRYFFWTEQAQFFGTQYVRDEDGNWKPGPYSEFLTGALETTFRLPARVKEGKPREDQNAASEKGSGEPTVSQELAERYGADQEDRKNLAALGSQTVMERDHERLRRVLEIVNGDGLRSGEDYYHAAMILQHSNPKAEGYTPQHYLLAHALATVAGFHGHKQGKWLSAAALDRYLDFSKQKQFFGTQYERDGEGLWQPGHHSEFLTDALRRQFHLPSQTEQEKRAAGWNQR
jgi:hypothetical protein